MPRSLPFVALLAAVCLPLTLACAAPVPHPVSPDLIVAADGTGDFRTIQSALESIPKDNRERRIVWVKNGRYVEKVRVDAACVTLRGESREGTRIEFAQGADDYKAKPDALGMGVITVSPTASDFVLQNLTVINTHGVVGPHAFAVYGTADRTVITDCDVLSDGADTLSIWPEPPMDGPIVAGQPPPAERGRSYYARLNVRGSVDFVCPRGWCYMVDSRLTQVNPRATAAVWHDGARAPEMKFVLRRCRLDGPPQWILARHHVDAQFYFVDCSFSSTMADRPPYRVVYPLSGGTPSEADLKRNAELDPLNRWGARAYFFNTHRDGGDFAWHADNLGFAPVPVRSDQIDASWSFDRTWNPERTDVPRVREVSGDGQEIVVHFSEDVTVKGRPRLLLSDGASLEYQSGSGTDRLRFAGACVGGAPDFRAATRLDTNEGVILSTEATVEPLVANVMLPTPPSRVPAFPGAEGFGSMTPGGRGGRVLFVTTLADSGPGSLREACAAKGPRIVVFRVSGTIAFKSNLVVTEPFLTVAGQSAPGEGICLRDHTFTVATHDVVVRYLRFRLGDESAQQDDSANLTSGASNCIFDHCSATWSVDECLSVSGNVYNVTVQWCLIGEPLHQSRHVKGEHGLGSLSRATGPVSWHHNLWLHTHSRNPRLGDNYGRAPYPFFDVRNNVVYNYVQSALGLTQGRFQVNYVGNYLRPGPDTRTRKPIAVGAPSQLEFHIQDNVLEGNEAATEDNRRFFAERELEGPVRISPAAFSAAAVVTVPAAKALEAVLASAGATRPRRDSVDERLVEQVRTRGGQLIDSQSMVGGWPLLQTASSPADLDEDGIADAWEQSQGLDPQRPEDANSDRDGNGYTAIEDYLNSLADAPFLP